MKKYLSFFLLSAALGIAPGPDILFVLAQSATSGASGGLLVTLGLCSGLCVHVTLAAFGFAAVMKRYPKLFAAINWFGALYLTYLGVMTWRSAGIVKVGGGLNQLPALELYLRGVIMNLCNPKVILFFLALMPRFIDEAKGRIALQFVGLGLIFIVATALVFGSVAGLGGLVSSYLAANANIGQMLGYFSAIVMFGLAAWIAWMNLKGEKK